MMKAVLTVLALLVCVGSGWASHRVALPVAETGEVLLEQAFDLALAQEIQSLVSTPLTPSRLDLVVTALAPERGSFVLGYSEAAVEDNATVEGRVLDVRMHSDLVRQRLRELGVLFTATSPQSYVLRLTGVEPSRTKRLGALQEMSGLQPVAVGGEELPVLALSQFGDWTGVLSSGEWSYSHTAKSLDEVWLSIWKMYFNRTVAGMSGGPGVVVRVSGWLSSQGPMEFDRLMDSWHAEVTQKALVTVEMDATGMVGMWRIQTSTRNALERRLKEAAAAQGLVLDLR